MSAAPREVRGFVSVCVAPYAHNEQRRGDRGRKYRRFDNEKRKGSMACKRGRPARVAFKTMMYPDSSAVDPKTSWWEKDEVLQPWWKRLIVARLEMGKVDWDFYYPGRATPRRADVYEAFKAFVVLCDRTALDGSNEVRVGNDFAEAFFKDKSPEEKGRIALDVTATLAHAGLERRELKRADMLPEVFAAVDAQAAAARTAAAASSSSSATAARTASSSAAAARTAVAASSSNSAAASNPLSESLPARGASAEVLRQSLPRPRVSSAFQSLALAVSAAQAAERAAQDDDKKETKKEEEKEDEPKSKARARESPAFEVANEAQQTVKRRVFQPKVPSMTATGSSSNRKSDKKRKGARGRKRFASPSAGGATKKKTKRAEKDDIARPSASRLAYSVRFSVSQSKLGGEYGCETVKRARDECVLALRAVGLTPPDDDDCGGDGETQQSLFATITELAAAIDAEEDDDYAWVLRPLICKLRRLEALQRKRTNEDEE